jgi:F-type H+-transporting ATPase subunit delta
MADATIRGYAAAIFELAQGEAVLDRVEGELFTLARALEGSNELKEALSDNRLPAERKQAVIDDLLGGGAHRLTCAFVSLAVGLGKGGNLAAIADAFTLRSAQARDRAVAEVRSAIPLDDATIHRLAGALAARIGNQVEVRVVVDESILGGLVARVGDTVIDGSVRKRLEQLREAVTG